MVKHAAVDHGYPWDDYLIEVASKHKGYTSVEIHPDADLEDISRYINNIRQQKDTATTSNVADLLDFLLLGYEAVYTTTTKSDGTMTRLYQAVHYHRLKELANHVNFMAILSAQVKDTLFGYIAQQHLDLPIVERDINGKGPLVQKHKNRVRIIPFLKEGKWSTTLREKAAKETLSINNQLVQSDVQVSVFAQEFADTILSRDDFLITLNTDEKLIDSLDRNGVTQTTTAVHGINRLRHLDHAVYLASTNPTPFDLKSLRMFAITNGLDDKKLIDAVMVERCYETAYQCVARTSIRNDHVKPDMEHIIIVPDMNYAEYIANWFEPGCALIDTNHSYEKTHKSDVRDQNKKERLDVITHLLTEKMNKKIKLAELFTKINISRSSYRRYIEEFRPELEQAGLIKPQQMKTTKQTA